MAPDPTTTGYAKPPRSTQFKAGQSGNPAGRPKGSPNRKTLVGWILSLSAEEVTPQAIQELMRANYPTLKARSIEEVMHLVQIVKAIVQRDTHAYNAVLDRAYGRPTKALEQTKYEDSPIQSEGKRDWIILDDTGGQLMAEY